MHDKSAITRILLVDDHRLFRSGLHSLLAKQPNVKIVGEAEDGVSAVRMAMELAPDVVLMDVSMPKLNGIEATRQILSQNVATHVIVLSMHADRRFVIEALKAGVLRRHSAPLGTVWSSHVATPRFVKSPSPSRLTRGSNFQRSVPVTGSSAMTRPSGVLT